MNFKRSQMNLTSALLALTCLAVVSLTACSPKRSDVDPRRDGFGLLTNRPQSYDHYLAVVRLKLPPLVQSTILKNGTPAIDEAARQALETEQQVFLSELAMISGKIRLIYSYKMVLNAVALEVPAEFKDRIEGLGTAVHIERTGFVAPPRLPVMMAAKLAELDHHGEVVDLSLETHKLTLNNPARLIGAEELHRRQKPIDGRGVKIGIMDSGIDYTHAMLGGPGTAAAYASVDAMKTSALFPNKVVVGGKDFTGDDFNPQLQDSGSFLPKADPNPIDLTEHGTHVAGIIAGRGNGVTLPTGIAPGAELYALKVFGKGPTSDLVILAAMDYAMDPNEDGQIDDHLDVLNLSLGYLFGSSTGLFAEAIRNLSKAGVITVTSAGNDGDVPYITAAPGTVDEAISVAATVDDSAVNIRVPSVAFISANIGRLLEERIEGSISMPLANLPTEVEGTLVDLGRATDFLSAEHAAFVKGKIALIARGGASFSEKLMIAKQAGAIGVVMTNTDDQPPFPMGGGQPVDIPAVMISRERGAQLRTEMSLQEVRANLNPKEQSQRFELIDAVAEFSSAGPRSVDSHIKPDIAAPGQNIISAGAGTGDGLITLTGTSMAGPFVAGAMALMKQAHPHLTVTLLKNMLMGRSLRVRGSNTRIGAGRLAVNRAVDSPVVLDRSSFSFGRIDLKDEKFVDQFVRVQNLTKQSVSYDYDFITDSAGITLMNPGRVTLADSEVKTLKLRFRLSSGALHSPSENWEGHFRLMQGQDEVYHLPALVVARRASGMVVSAHSPGSVTLKNMGKNESRALLFNLLGRDDAKPQDGLTKSVCDLQAAGYRIVKKEVGGRAGEFLQVAVKLYSPMTTFHFCEATVLIDLNQDGVADQELALAALGRIPGFSIYTKPDYSFSSLLLDADKMRTIRRENEERITYGGRMVESDYVPALIEMLPAEMMEQTSIMILEARLDSIGQTEIQIKVATLQVDGVNAQADDYLGEKDSAWLPLSLKPEAQSFVGLPESLTLAGGEKQKLNLSQGQGQAELMILLPNHESNAMRNLRP